MSLLESSLVGHSIRIISKAQIRYEGTLFSIRKDENNDLVLVLSKVTSYGTEDRPCEHPVKPLNEVYEHIAFRGRELVDLVLLPTPRVGADPSIISVELESGPISDDKPKSSGDAPVASSIIRHSDNPPITGFPNFMVPKQSTDLLSDNPSSSWNNLSGLICNDNVRPDATTSSIAITPSVAESENAGSFDDISTNVLKKVERCDSQNKPRGRGFRQEFSTSQRYRGRSNASRTDDRPQGSSNSNHTSNPRRSYNPRVRHYDRVSHPRFEDVDFKVDYDFDKPNAELAEFLEKVNISAADSSETESAGQSTQNPDTYDGSKSFFDTLSSELMDRAHGVVKNHSRREYRKQNLDTFGPTANLIGPPVRGGYRGRKGGHYRGNQRGWYGHNTKQGYSLNDGRNPGASKQQQ